MFVADGRFHLEAIMIANPTVPAYRQGARHRNLGMSCEHVRRPDDSSVLHGGVLPVTVG